MHHLVPQIIGSSCIAVAMTLPLAQVVDAVVPDATAPWVNAGAFTCIFALAWYLITRAIPTGFDKLTQAHGEMLDKYRQDVARMFSQLDQQYAQLAEKFDKSVARLSDTVDRMVENCARTRNLG